MTDNFLSEDSATGEPVVSFYDAIGGAPTFHRLVAEFYRGVATDPVLRPLYPDDDLPGAEDRLRMFLEQYWGGPRTYGEQRGHPRLRMRHVPFVIGERERDAWLLHMRTAVDSLSLPPDYDATLWSYLESAANSLVNARSDAPYAEAASELLTPDPKRVVVELSDRPDPGPPIS